MMRVEQFERSDFVLADDAGDAGESKLQFFWLGGWREEKSSLGRARSSRFRGEMNFHDRCSGRMRVEIELQKL